MNFLPSLLLLIVLASNLMAVKTVDIAIPEFLISQFPNFPISQFTLPAAIILYPFAFVVGDLITEFHGFKATRRAVVFALLCNAGFAGLLALAAIMPPSQHFPHDEAFRTICLAAPRIVIASFTAFLASGVLNGWIFAFLKKHAHPLLTRSSVSTIVGVILDSTIFITIAYAGKYPLGMMILGQILAKLLVGIGIGVPLTCRFVALAAWRRHAD